MPGAADGDEMRQDVYKRQMQDILDNIGPTAEVRKIIRPIYNFKAGDED